MHNNVVTPRYPRDAIGAPAHARHEPAPATDTGVAPRRRQRGVASLPGAAADPVELPVHAAELSVQRRGRAWQGDPIDATGRPKHAACLAVHKQSHRLHRVPRLAPPLTMPSLGALTATRRGVPRTTRALGGRAKRTLCARRTILALTLAALETSEAKVRSCLRTQPATAHGMPRPPAGVHRARVATMRRSITYSTAR